jgi:hypothetical protein
MTERLALSLIGGLTAIGMICVIGMIVLEYSARPTLGNLPSIVTAVVVALTGLVAVLGKSLTPQLERIQKTADEIHVQTNSGLSDLRAELTAARAEISRLQHVRKLDDNPGTHL